MGVGWSAALRGKAPMHWEALSHTAPEALPYLPEGAVSGQARPRKPPPCLSLWITVPGGRTMCGGVSLGLGCPGQCQVRMRQHGNFLLGPSE